MRRGTGIAHSSGCVRGTSVGCGEELLSWLDASMQKLGKLVRLPIYAIQNDVTGIAVPAVQSPPYLCQEQKNKELRTNRK